MSKIIYNHLLVDEKETLVIQLVLGMELRNGGRGGGVNRGVLENWTLLNCGFDEKSDDLLYSCCDNGILLLVGTEFGPSLKRKHLHKFHIQHSL